MNRFKRAAGPAFLVAALLLFTAFHFRPAFGTSRGWELWVQFWDLAVNQRTLLKGGMSPMIATFATFSAGILASPCAIPLIRKSLLVRWFIAFISALVCLGFHEKAVKRELRFTSRFRSAVGGGGGSG